VKYGSKKERMSSRSLGCDVCPDLLKQLPILMKQY